MTHKFPMMLVAFSLVGSGTALGCVDSTSRNDVVVHSDSRVDVERNSFTPMTPELSTWSSAATPLGWADRAERRAAEEAFARGEESPIEPPNAIGGGPTLD